MIFIQSIEVFASNAAPQSWLSNNTGAGAVEIENGLLVLNVGGYEDIQGLPLAVLNRVQSDPAAYIPSVYDLFLFNDLYKVDWTKSYVQLAVANAAPYSYLFGVRYRDNRENINGARL